MAGKTRHSALLKARRFDLSQVFVTRDSICPVPPEPFLMVSVIRKPAFCIPQGHEVRIEILANAKATAVLEPVVDIVDSIAAVTLSADLTGSCSVAFGRINEPRRLRGQVGSNLAGCPSFVKLHVMLRRSVTGFTGDPQFRSRGMELRGCLVKSRHATNRVALDTIHIPDREERSGVCRSQQRILTSNPLLVRQQEEPGEIPQTVFPLNPESLHVV